jgi:hypothetical protein
MTTEVPERLQQEVVYLPPDASRIEFNPGEAPGTLFGGPGLSYGLPAGSSFEDWLADLKSYYKARGWYRLDRSLISYGQKVGDSGGWIHYTSDPSSAAWIEFWVNPSQEEAVFISLVSKGLSTDDDAVMTDPASVSMRHYSGPEMKKLIENYAEYYDAPWEDAAPSATQESAEQGQ